MASYTIGSNNYNSATLSIITASSSGSEGGTTTLSWTIQYKLGSSAADGVTPLAPYTLTIDGTTYEGTTSFSSGTSSRATGTAVIQHNFAPKSSVSFSVTVDHSRYAALSTSGTHAITPPKIASKVTVPTATIGATPTIRISRTKSGYTDTLTYTFGSHGGTIVEKTSVTSYNGFTYPHTFYAEIENYKYGIGVITCETYDGDELIGESYTEFRANADEATSKPTISPTITDANAATVALTGDADTMVRYMSTASITIGAEARNYATLKSQLCENGSKAITTATGTIAGVEQAKFSLSATDSRGYTTTLSLTKPFVEYAKPTCNIVESRPDTAGNMTVMCAGSYWAGNFGAADNTLAAQYRYKVKDGSYSAWVDMDVSTNGNDYTATADLTGLDYQTAYVFQTRAIDALNTATSSEASVITLPVFHWSESDFVFEVPVTFKQGGEGIGSDVDMSDYYTKDEVYSKDEVDELIPTDTTDSRVKYGTWTPKLSSMTPVTAGSSGGWYMKVGNVVTVGFYIDFTCSTGYHTTALQITGLPFTASTPAFGGGLLYNAYIASVGFCFECWAVSAATITPRLQPCNPTAVGNLSVSSSAYFPKNGGNLKLSGTITYKTTS